ncbi:MAG: hypothetical protein KDA78_13085 [Planctomycetaceae bacterium]|nr:hypothetical protein [Planctomycetaceae bacterium]
MSKLIFLFAGILLGGILMIGAFNYHVVATADQTFLITRTESGLSDLYVNVSEWDAEEWSRHQQLASACTQSGHGDLVKKSFSDQIIDILSEQIGRATR